jgi:hypothetical protein
MAMATCAPEGGRVLLVSIYPSEFGLKCMHVKAALIGADCEEEEDGDLDSETENNKLRTYGLNRQRLITNKSI